MNVPLIQVFYADDDCTYPFNPGIPTLLQGGQPIDWTWNLKWPGNPPVMPPVDISGGSTTPDDGPDPLPIVTADPHEYDFQLGTTTITWTATNAAGSANCFHTITVIDDTPPVIFELDPLEECVLPIIEAAYDETTMDITPERPDYFPFEEESTMLDINILILATIVI